MPDTSEELVRLTLVHGTARFWVKIRTIEAHEFDGHLVFNLPGPRDPQKRSGLMLPDPRHADIELHLTWGELPGPQPAVTLQAVLGGHTWEFHQDPRNPDHWLRDNDHERDWS